MLKYAKVKAKDSEINAVPLCLGNISNNFSVDNMKKTELYGYIYDFSVGYDARTVDDILDIEKYLMKRMVYEWSNSINKMFWFIKRIFITIVAFIRLNGYNVMNAVSLNCVSIRNQECRVRPVLININSIEPLSYPYSVGISKLSDSCKNINNLCAKYVFLMFLKTRILNCLIYCQEQMKHVIYHGMKLACKCRLDASVCNEKQRWNRDKWRCERKELIDKDRCDDGFIWNPSACECECE